MLQLCKVRPFNDLCHLILVNPIGIHLLNNLHFYLDDHVVTSLKLRNVGAFDRASGL